MVEKSYISQLVREFVKETEYFIVDVRVSSTGKITVLIDKRSGGLMVEDCVKLSKFIEGNLDREKEDFEL
jgi:ribosome maturation factor RimP